MAMNKGRGIAGRNGGISLINNSNKRKNINKFKKNFNKSLI